MCLQFNVFYSFFQVQTIVDHHYDAIKTSSRVRFADPTTAEIQNNVSILILLSNFVLNSISQTNYLR